MINKKIRMVVSDLDGTLLGPDLEITETTRIAVAEAEKRGIRFSLCTGRTESHIRVFQKQLNIHTPMILMNGALIWDPVKQCALWECPMDNDEMLSLIYFCRDIGIDYCCYMAEATYFSPHNIRWARFERYNQMAEREGVPPMVMLLFDENFECVRNRTVYKMLLCETQPGQLLKARAFIDALPNTDYTTSDSKLLDVAHEGIDKGSRLVWLADHLQVPIEEVCAVGDFDNDIPMLKSSGFPVAMGNATDAVKEIAQYVTKSNAENGVAYLLDQLS